MTFDGLAIGCDLLGAQFAVQLTSRVAITPFHQILKALIGRPKGPLGDSAAGVVRTCVLRHGVRPEN